MIPKEQFLIATERMIQESIQAKQELCKTSKEIIVDMADMISRAFIAGHRLFLFGNGGSAADAQHLAAEFVNRFQMERRPLPAMALTVDTSVLTSIANDYSFEDVFAKQLRALSQPGDIALGISTSGRSRNVIEALKYARENGITTLGFSGPSQTEMDLWSDIILHPPSPVTARVQECHITVGHIICAHVEQMLFGGGNVNRAESR